MSSPPPAKVTPGQTIGPFYGFALPFADGEVMAPPGHPASVRLHGTVRDGAGQPVPDALLELWQADDRGAIPARAGSWRRDGAFTGWGRAGTDAGGGYVFRTVRPGPTAAGVAPFFALTVFARGLLDRLFTRVYLPGVDVDRDPLLAGLPPLRRASLIAVEDDGLRFDVVLQGPGETVFLRPRAQG